MNRPTEQQMSRLSSKPSQFLSQYIEDFRRSLSFINDLKNSFEELAASNSEKTNAAALDELDRKIFEQIRRVVTKFALTPEVYKLSDYTQLWLSLIPFLKNPEELFAYLIAVEIGLSHIEFYLAMIDFYIGRCEFILASQVIELFVEKNGREAYARMIHEKDLEEYLEKVLEEAILDDFVSRGFERVDFTGEPGYIDYHHDLDNAPAISDDDFNEIQSINFCKRMEKLRWSILGQNNTLEDLEKIPDEPRKQKSICRNQLKPSGSQAKSKRLSKRYSDLINVFVAENFPLYLDRGYRSHVPGYKRKAYEYAFLTKLYGQNRRQLPYAWKRNRYPFWIKIEKKQRLVQLILTRISFSKKQPSGSDVNQNDRNSSNRLHLGHYSTAKTRMDDHIEPHYYATEYKSISIAHEIKEDIPLGFTDWKSITGNSLTPTKTPKFSNDKPSSSINCYVKLDFSKSPLKDLEQLPTNDSSINRSGNSSLNINQI